ncbi:MAG: hypothetical protein D6681_21085 [Calditrichaeota bacterium]|nr:MAG: hypothetical protein D6681_21085 [Calditrichota bacterium]
MEACYLYILYSPSLDRYYVGTSHKLHLRLKYHNSSPRGYTRRGSTVPTQPGRQGMRQIS